MRLSIVTKLLTVGALLAGCYQGYNQADLEASESVEEAGLTLEAREGVLLDQDGCPQPAGNGTVDPAVSIYSMVFEVDGLELEVLPGESLPVQPGDEVRLIEVTLCTVTYTGNPGEVCVDLAPLTSAGEMLSSQHAGTHMGVIVSGRITLAGPEYSWTVDDTWTGFSVVVNHWAPDTTEDLDCAGGQCEQDDRLMIGFE
jgi:hypothetical protein